MENVATALTYTWDMIEITAVSANFAHVPGRAREKKAGAVIRIQRDPAATGK